jgi:hypothetical protein
VAICGKAVLQADGSYLLGFDPSVQDVTTCQYVVESGADVSNNFLQMSAEDGAVYSAGLISVWAAAWAFRGVIDVIKGSISE